MVAKAPTIPTPVFSPQTFADPYPVYRVLREHAPVHWEPALRVWLVTRYADVVPLLRDARLTSMLEGDPTLPNPLAAEVQTLVDGLGKQLLFSDPPAHTRRRIVLNKAFTPRVLESARGRVERVAAGLLDHVIDHGQMDLIRDFAYPLPAIAIAELLGLPAEDLDQFKKWSTDRMAFFGKPSDPELAGRAYQSHFQLTDYLRRMADERRRAPQHDLLSNLVQMEEGKKLDDDEIFANCVALMSAGHETTTALLGNAVLTLLRRPDRLRQLRDNLDLLATAVEELMRFDSPVHLVRRRAREDIEFEGRTIKAGDGLFLMIGSANRDPAQFPDADEVILDRKDNRHLSFGFGGHFCIGATLARMEAQIALKELLVRLPDMRLRPEPIEWHMNPLLHGVKALPLAW